MDNNKNAEIMAIPMQVSPTEFALIVVLKDINLERIKQYDPSTLPLESIYSLFPGLKLRTITIAYATPKEVQKIVDNYKVGGSIKPILKMLGRGWQYRPEFGDSEEPPTVLLPPGRG